MNLSLYNIFDIQCVKLNLLYSRILPDQKSSGSRPDSLSVAKTRQGDLTGQPQCRFLSRHFSFVPAGREACPDMTNAVRNRQGLS
jgi:hypothetical protein